jgi:hypothetical protein
MYKILIIFAAALISACSSAGAFRKMASGEIGCPPKKIKVSNANSAWVMDGQRTFQAECDGIVYYCSYYNKDFGSIKCKEARHDRQEYSRQEYDK